MQIVLLLFSVQCLPAQNRFIDSLQRIVNLQHHDTTEINALLNLTYEFLRKDLGKAKSLAHQSVSLSQTLQNNHRLVNSYQYLVAIYQDMGKIDSALFYLDLMKHITEREPAEWLQRTNYNQAAGLFYKNTGQYKKALSFMLDNLNYFKKENENRAGMCLNIGNTYYALGDLKHAVEYHLQSLSLFEKLNNQRGQSFCLQSLGNDFLNSKQLSHAKDYFQRSLTLKQEMKDKRGIISSSQGLGQVFKELKQFKSSERYYLISLHMSREMKFMQEELISLNQLGLLYKNMGDVAAARAKLKEGLKLARQMGDSTESAKIRSELIGINVEEQKEKETELTLIANLHTVISSGDRRGEALEYSRLSAYYALNKQFDKAYEFQKKFEALNDSVQGNAVILQLRDIEEKYKNEKNEKEIALLKKDQELQILAISRQKIVITAIIIAFISVAGIGVLLVNRYRVLNKAKRQVEMEQIRNNIARDLHDDIGSTLSSINILSKVALIKKQEEAGNYLQLIGDQSTRIMENMGDIVWSINPQNDSLEKVIIRMREFASEILEPQNIEYRFTENIKAALALGADKRKGLFLIYKESINNAAKYSAGKRIEISIHQTEGTLQLSVKDDGKGFDEQTIKVGNGLRNLRERAREMNAVITIDSAIGKGTEVTLTLPLA